MTALAAGIRLTGFRPLYHAGQRCPACAGTHWLVGRASAQCARCATTLPIAAAGEASRG